MRASATLSEPTLSVDPGREAACELRIKNIGTVVDQFSVEVLGDAHAWARVEPAAVSLMPGAEAKVRVIFAPPRSSDATAGSKPFGLRVISSAAPDESVVEEGTLSVGIFSDHVAELIPRTVTGSRSARTDLAFDNRGNARISAGLVGADPDALLTFAFRPATLLAEPGTATFVKVTARPRKRFLLGNPKSHPYQVQVVAEGVPPVIADGTYIQTPGIPKWVPKLLAALVAAAIVLAVLWFALLRPVIQSTAKDAATDAANTAVAKKLAGQPGGGGSGSGSGSGSGAKTPTAAPSTAAATPTPSLTVSPLGNPISQQLALTVALNATGQSAYTVPAAATLSVTDIVFENPQGDAGDLTVERDGKPLLTVQLANFRDLDYHFVSPLTYTGGKSFTIVVTCQTVGTTGPPPPGGCHDFVFFSGYQK